MLAPEKLKAEFEKVEEEYWLLRSFLTGQKPNEVDKIVNRLHRELFAGFDCVACSNCCKEIVPVLEEKKICAISAKLGLSPEAYKSEFLVATEDGFMIKEKPCPHLGVTGCSLYECRPEDCREYPFTDKKEVVGRLINLVTNCSVCPVLFEIFKQLKQHYKAEFTRFKAEQQEVSWFDETNDEYEDWEVEEEFISQSDWAGLVKYRCQQVENHPEDFDCKKDLGAAYVLNREYGKAMFYLYDLHKKQPDQIDVQHMLLDALFAMGKDETAVNWIVQPKILRLNNAILDSCYNFVRPKRKQQPVDDIYLALLEEGYVTFGTNELINALYSDKRFSVKGGPEKSDNYTVSIIKKNKKENN